MHLAKGFSLAWKYYPLVVLAALVDLLNLGDISRRFQEELHIKFTVPSALPSLTQVLPDPPVGGSFLNMGIPYLYLGGLGLLVFLGLILLGAFLKGGFLGCVTEGLTDGKVGREAFFSYARKFWGRFLVQTVIIFSAAVFLGLLVLGIGPLAIIFIILFLAAFLLLIFWDYSMVLENLSVVDAAERSWRLVVANLGKVILFLVPILLITASFSILANAMAAMPLALISIAGYGYLGTGIIFAMMSFYLELITEDVTPEEME